MGQSEKNRTMGKREGSKDLHQEDPVQKTADPELAAQIRQILRDRRHPGRCHSRTDGDPSGFGLQVNTYHENDCKHYAAYFPVFFFQWHSRIAGTIRSVRFLFGGHSLHILW